jgi:hypothetical protein
MTNLTIINDFRRFQSTVRITDEQFKVMVLSSLNPPAGGCASMRADIGDNVPAFKILLGDIDYRFRGHH